MTCLHCREPIRRCTAEDHRMPCECNGWVHARYGVHACTNHPKAKTDAEPQGRAA